MLRTSTKKGTRLFASNDSEHTYDAAEIVAGQAQDALRVLDRLLQPRLAQLGAVRAPEHVGAHAGQAVARALLARAGGELRVARADDGLGGAVDDALLVRALDAEVGVHVFVQLHR